MYIGILIYYRQKPIDLISFGINMLSHIYLNKTSEKLRQWIFCRSIVNVNVTQSSQKHVRNHSQHNSM
jgi:hypothetical protein